MPGVEHVAVGASVADDGRHHRQRAVVERRRSEADLLEILEGVDPGPQLGDARDAHDVPRGRGAADRHHVDRHAARPERVGHPDRDLALATTDRRLLDRIRRPVGVAVVHDPDEREARQLGDPFGQRDGVLRRGRAGPSRSAVDADDHVDLPPATVEECRGRLRAVEAVDLEAHLRPIEQGDETGELDLADQRVGHEQVVEPGVDHHLGLAELGDRQADRPVRQLAFGDLAGLVRLGVRAMGHPGLAGDGGHRREVRFESGEVDQRDRRVEVPDGSSAPVGHLAARSR